MSVTTKRAYEPPETDDGYRVLVDRVWPRGITKQALHIHGWYRDLAPTSALRMWFNHDPAKWPGFRRRYLRQLHSQNAELQLRELAAIARHQNLTLVYGARDTEHNQAAVLREYLLQLHPGKAS